MEPARLSMANKPLRSHDQNLIHSVKSGGIDLSISLSFGNSCGGAEGCPILY